jgi:hypothetical protein
MNESWSETEFFSADLGDERLKRRLSVISEKFSHSPLSPINNACGNWAETKAAYRFFSNEKVNYQEITKSHIESTKERCQEYFVVLAIQDTSYFNYSHHPKTKGLCTLSRKKGRYKDEVVTQGLVMHSAFVVGTDGLPLGIADQKIYSRSQPETKLGSKKKKTEKTRRPTEEKDGFRWIETLENTCSNLQGVSSRIVTVCDREADIFDLFLRAKQLEAPFVVRGHYNRTVNKESSFSDNGVKLWDLLKKQPVQTNITILVPKQKNMAQRFANCEVKYSPFVMHIPKDYREGKYLKNPENLNLCAIYVSEINCPENVEAIEWMLITNIAVPNLKEALEIIEWYCLRWRIETWHKVLKSGLQVEECRLSTADRLVRYLAVMSIVAWRIFWVTLIARVSPDASVSIFLSGTEWKLLATKFSRSSKEKLEEPTLEQAIRWIAQLGGFMARKGDKQPGITHIWRGLQKFAAMLEGAELANGFVGNR